MLACDHRQAKEEVEKFKEAYKVEYDKLTKSIFTANQVAPVLGQSSNLITFLLAIKELESVSKQQNDASFDDLEEMLEIQAIKKETVKRQSMKEIYKTHRCTSFSYPRLKDAHLVEYGKIDIICSEDASTGLMITMHLSHPNSLKTRNINFHTSHSYLADAGTTVPKRELTAGSIGSF